MTADATAPRLPRWLGPTLGAVLVLVCIFATTQFRAIEVVVAGLIDACFLAAWLAGGWGIGNLLLSRCTRDVDPLLRHVTHCAIGVGAIGIGFHLLGLAGALSVVSIGAVLLVGIGAGAASVYRSRRDRATSKPVAFGDGVVQLIGWGLIALPLAIAIISASVIPGILWAPLDPHPYDVLSYHLQVPREWYDAGRIIPLEHNAFSFFPMLMETHYLAAMHLRGGPWEGMYLCQFITLAHGVLATLAVFAIVRAKWKTPVLAWIAALVCAGTPWVLMLASVCYVEAGVMLYTTLACGWVMLGSSWRGAILVGASLGLACGMKYTAFVMAGAVVPLAWLVTTKPSKALILHVAVACLVAGAVASPWLIRNLAWTGNPVFPLATSVFGRGHFTEQQVERYQVAHRLPEAESPWRVRVPLALKRTLGEVQFGYVLLPLAILAGGVIAVRKPGAGVVVVTMLGMAVVWISATHVMPRFITPIVPLAAIAVAGAVASMPGRILPGATLATLMLVLLQTGLGLVWTAKRLLTNIEGNSVVLVRLENYDRLLPPELAAAQLTGDKVALVGEAKAFLCRIPSDRLLYRSVFDVRGDRWLGAPADDLRRQGYWVLMDPPELMRLTLTYRHIDPDPVEPRMPYVLPPLK